MMRCAVDVRPSDIHGLGLFARAPIPSGTVVWEFAAGDSRVPVATADGATLHYGYINPENPEYVVVCGDDARYWNFAPDANCGEAEAPSRVREARIVALRDIAVGEELTITLSSDADSARKLGFQPLCAYVI